MINTELILATKGEEGSSNGLITFLINIPYYLWVECLVHKRFSRNASSARAQSTDKHLANGFYCPEFFYKDQRGMQSSSELINYQWRAEEIYNEVWEYCQNAAKELEQLGVCKEQRNRIIPPIKIIKGVMTGTENAWDEFLKLRDNELADKSMQIFARQIRDKIENAEWVYSDYHIPFRKPEEINSFSSIKLSAARIARVSYDKPKEGKNDDELAESLLINGHFSPFEHQAIWQYNPLTSALCSKKADYDNGYGWSNYRSILERNKEI